jgi:hypothetical protein
MIRKLALLATIAAPTIVLRAVALAQSAYTAGNAESSAAAGYPSPYGSGSSLYAYAPSYGYSHDYRSRRSRPGSRAEPGRFGRE